MAYRNETIADLLAAEYVIGTLKGRARRRFERLLQERSDVAALVQNWDHTLNQLAPLVMPVPPPPEAWQKINQRIAIEYPIEQSRNGRNSKFWHVVALGNGLIALVLFVLLLLPGYLTEPTYLVLLNNEQEQPVWLIDTSSSQKRLQVKNLRPISIPPGKHCILWIQPEGAIRYYPIGALPDDGSDTILPISDDFRAMLPGKLMVSLEDEDTASLSTKRPTRRMSYRSQWLAVRAID